MGDSIARQPFADWQVTPTVPSIRSHVIRFFSAHYMKRVTPYADLEKLRTGLESRTTLLPPARGVEIRRDVIESVDCEWHIPVGCEEAPIIYYLHGGAYVMGSPATHRRLVSHIAKLANMRALLPDYRLAPEARYPAALEDSLRVYRALKGSAERNTHIAIGGDSAGGNLAMATILALRDAGEKLPHACFLMSPWLDMTATGESLATRAKLDPWFRPEYVLPTAEKMFRDADRRDPLVSPVFANLDNLPPTLVHVGDHEILLSDSTRIAERIRQSGGDVELQIWPDMWHVFQFFVGQMPESDQSIRAIAAFLRNKNLVVAAQERAA